MPQMPLPAAIGSFYGYTSAAAPRMNIMSNLPWGVPQSLRFKQIAGLIARRIVFNKKVGDTVARGERVGLIKFGSRVDVLMRPEVKLAVQVGDHVKGASSVLAYAPVAQDTAPSKMQPTVAGTN